MKEENAVKAENTSILDDVTEIVESILLSVFVVLLVFTYLFRLSDVSGPSMEPTLTEKDRVVISPLFYTPEQNDIIIVNSSKLDKLIVKRVVALEGQSVDIDFEKGIVSVDGEPLDEQLYIVGENGEKPELKADHFVNTLTTMIWVPLNPIRSQYRRDVYLSSVTTETVQRTASTLNSDSFLKRR